MPMAVAIRHRNPVAPGGLSVGLADDYGGCSTTLIEVVDAKQDERSDPGT